MQLEIYFLNVNRYIYIFLMIKNNYKENGWFNYYERKNKLFTKC